MHYRSLLGALALTVMSASVAGAQIADITKYPDLKGQWNRKVVPGVRGQPSYDQTTIRGARAGAADAGIPGRPEASLADQAAGGQGNDPTVHAACRPACRGS